MAVYVYTNCNGKEAASPSKEAASPTPGAEESQLLHDVTLASKVKKYKNTILHIALQ